MRGASGILWAVALALGLAGTTFTNGFGQSPPGLNLTDLTNDVSRAELFQLVIDAANAQSPLPPGGAQSFNLWGPFSFPTDATYDLVAGKPRTNSIFGIDISHYTPDGLPLQDLSQWKATFAYAKATQGTTFKDGKFAGYWKALGQLTGGARVHRGAYHFLASDVHESGMDQAKTFVAFLAQNGGLKPTDMPPALDLEWDIASQGAPDRWAGQDPDQIVDKVIEFMTYVQQQTHRTPMLYTAAAWWRSINGQAKAARLNAYKLWVADYSKTSRGVEVPTVPPGTQAALWQFTSSARLPGGYQGTLDANIYKKAEADFYTDFGVQKFN
jgi:lysozyme